MTVPLETLVQIFPFTSRPTGRLTSGGRPVAPDADHIPPLRPPAG